jgi:succinate dehydrogenase / fumarate reductase membrane anchor subunit
MMTATSKQLGYQPKAPRGNAFETRAWQFMRWSGVLLLPLAFIHLIFMHIINSVYDINYQWVITQRWLWLGWRIYDVFLLMFAGLHGFNGLRYVINDYVADPGVKRILKTLSVILLIVVLVVGAIAVVAAPFVPDPTVPTEDGARIIQSILLL